MKSISEESFAVLIGVMEQFFQLSPKFKLDLKGRLLETTYKKGARILNAGSKQQMVWFMLEGLAREIRVNSETFEEKTIWFWSGLSFLYTTPGFFNREASESTIELMEDCHVVMISYDDWAELKHNFEETEMVTEKIRGEYDHIRQHHADDIKNLSTDERYLKHEALIQDLLGRTQIRYIAEFMGMAADTLGRLRKKYAKKH